MTTSPQLTGLLAGLLVIGIFTDTVKHKLPNFLTITGLVLGLVLQAWLHGVAGMTDGLLGALAAMALFFPFFAVRWMGAGDVKMLMAVGVCLGWRNGLVADLATLASGAAAACGILAWRGGLWRYLRRYGAMAKCLLFTGQFAYIPPEPGDLATERFPYAFAIALGTLAALYEAGDMAALKRSLGL